MTEGRPAASLPGQRKEDEQPKPQKRRVQVFLTQGGGGGKVLTRMKRGRENHNFPFVDLGEKEICVTSELKIVRPFLVEGAQSFSEGEGYGVRQKRTRRGL